MRAAHTQGVSMNAKTVSGSGGDGGNATPRSRAFWALVLLVPAASLGTWAGMIGGPDTLWGKAVYAAMKAWLLWFPAVWLLTVERGRLRRPQFSFDGWGAGLVTGLLIFAAIVGGYWLFGRDAIDTTFVRERIEAVGLNSAWKYVAFAAYVTFINALIEEYVWRWFVARQCSDLLRSRAAAIVLAALCFTAHHVIALSVYFGAAVTALASAGVFIGGVVWSVLYLRYRSLTGPYISHILADVAIFVVGWHIIAG